MAAKPALSSSPLAHFPASYGYGQHRTNESAVAACRSNRRSQSLARIAAASEEMNWSVGLLRALLEELYVDEEISQFLGDPRQLPRRRYPQAVVLAIAIRHSWQVDDLRRLTRRL